MKLQHLIRICLAAFALAEFSTLVRAQTVIGPGVVPAPVFINGDARILAGTQIVATQVSSNGQSISGGGGVSYNFYSNTTDFEGGLIEGADVTAQAEVVTAIGGTAIFGVNGYNYHNFHDGTYRGGSVLLADQNQVATSRGGSAYWITGNDSLVNLKIDGGLFEGGAVSLASAPDTILSRAPALRLEGDYGGVADIYGGEFIGGIGYSASYGVPRLTFYGSGIEISPPPLSTGFPNEAFFVGRLDATVSGIYEDGSPFSTVVHIAPANGPRTYLRFDADRLVLNGPRVPEPAAAPLAALGIVALSAIRRRRTSGFPA